MNPYVPRKGDFVAVTFDLGGLPIACWKRFSRYLMHAFTKGQKLGSVLGEYQPTH